MRRIEADLGRVRAPALAFPVPDGWHHVEDVATLQQAGRIFQNCVAHLAGGGLDHFRRVIIGEVVVLVTRAPVPLLAELEHLGPSVWRLGSVVGPQNQRAPDDVLPCLSANLSGLMEKRGHTLLARSPYFDLDAVATFAGEGGEELHWL